MRHLDGSLDAIAGFSADDPTWFDAADGGVGNVALVDVSLIRPGPKPAAVHEGQKAAPPAEIAPGTDRSGSDQPAPIAATVPSDAPASANAWQENGQAAVSPALLTLLDVPQAAVPNLPGPAKEDATPGVIAAASGVDSAGAFAVTDVSSECVVLGASSVVAASATRVTDDYSDHALQADTARSTYGIDGSVTSTGSVIRIGILSDSFNYLGGAAADEADGDLPTAANVHIISDSSGGDEGRAMAELVHRIAPGAQIYFYTANGSQTTFATGINTLQADGCQVIIDDESYFAEPFYQADGTVQKAIDTVTSKGVTYFTAVTNNGHDYYEANWSNIANFALPGIGTENVHNVSGGSPYETFTNTYGDAPYFDLQWAAPFASLGGAGDTFSIGEAIYDMTSGTPVLVANLRPNSGIGGDPTNINVVSPTSGHTSYAVVFYGYAGVTPSGAFKVIIENDSSVNFTGVGSGTGSGATYGHNAAADANPTAAVYYGNTPANGGTLTNESFSSEGGTVLYYDAAGNKLATPVTIANAAFSSTDGDTTSDPKISPFYGTSAAAPDAGACAALVLAEDGRLTNTQVSYLLGATATAFGNDLYSGDGLINANAAVAAAHVAVTSPIWTGQGGSSLWSANANWSDNAAPTASTNVVISNGIGLFSVGYTVIDNLATSAAATLQIDGAGAALYALAAVATPVLQVAAGSLLTTAAITVGLGNLDILGRVTDTGMFSVGSAAATSATEATATTKATIEAGGTFEIGAADSASIAFNGVGSTLVLDTSALSTGVTGAISGFAASDRIDLSQLGYSSADKVAISSGVVTISNGATVLASLALTGTYSGLTLSSDSAAGTLISVGAKALPADFNGDGSSDILFQNVNGAIDGWLMNGLSLSSSGVIANPTTAWTAVATGDFNGDGKSDILYQNQDGTIDIWQMNGLGIATTGIVANPGTSWHAIATGDFNADGMSDILFQNNDGSVDIWTMNGAAIATSGVVANPGNTWHAIATGDFNGDGKSDIVLQNDDGSIDVWEMNGSTLTASGIVANPSPAWRAVGTGDFNGDGKSDIVLQNKDGTVAIWTMNGLSMTASTIVADPGPSWHAIAVGDYNGDGNSDILFQNDDGTMDAWLMNGTTLASSGSIANPTAAWQAIGLGSMHFIDGTQSTGTLTGTILADNFVFTTSQQGAHIINGFDPLHDVISLNQTKFGAFSAVQAAESTVNGSTVLALGVNDTLTISGVLPGALAAKNFV